MSNMNEKKALEIFNKGIKKLFKENFLDAYIYFNKITTVYPDTHMALKSRFMLTMISIINLFVKCILTESFYGGLKSVKKNPIIDLFSKESNYYSNQYEKHSLKRKQAFESFKKILANLLERETYDIVHIYVNLSKERYKDCNPLLELNSIKTGKIITETELTRLINDTYYYLLVTVISDNFDIEYADELSSMTKRKLNRIDLYHSCYTWLLKFYENDPDPVVKDMIKKCCAIILGLSIDKPDRKRQEAYETLSQLSVDYYSMVGYKDKITENAVEDIQEYDFPEISKKNINKDSIVNLITNDEVSIGQKKQGFIDEYSTLKLELQFDSDKDMNKSKSDREIEKSTNSLESQDELKIEFE